MGIERTRMLAGELYDPHDAELVRLRARARDLCWDLNATREADTELRRRLLVSLFGSGGNTAWVQPPFYCDYGSNIELGIGVFFNFNCVVLDVCPVRIGDYTLIGPAVQIYTATHPIEADLRRTREFAKPITIGSDVWIGGGAILCPGVTIGNRTVIGAGSVVTRSLPEGVVAAGNPCRVLRPVETIRQFTVGSHDNAPATAEFPPASRYLTDMNTTPEAVSVVIPVRNVAGTIDGLTSGWISALNSIGRPWELLIVDDGSTDGTAAKAELAVQRGKNSRVLMLKAPAGFGACLRLALPEVQHPLVATSADDYPYTPADLKNLLARMDVESEFQDPATDQLVMRKPDIVNGCRTGVAVPFFWKTLGRLYRGFCRIALGLPLDPLPGWLGLREHLRSWGAWIVYGVPLEDPNSAFKAYRKAFLERFPIQSDGDFARIELVAKSTFLTCILDEIPLTPKSGSIPHAVWLSADRKRVFRKPLFTIVPKPAVEVEPATM